MYTLSAHRVALVETMKALLHRFVRICPSCGADRFRIHLIPDGGPDLLHRTDLWLRRSASDGIICINGYRQGMKRPICLQTSCWKKTISFFQSVVLSHRVNLEIFLCEEGFFHCLWKQQINCVCNNLLWDVCLCCKH